MAVRKVRDNQGADERTAVAKGNHAEPGAVEQKSAASAAKGEPFAAGRAGHSAEAKPAVRVAGHVPDAERE